jgi:hypothetical protein
MIPIMVKMSSRSVFGFLTTTTRGYAFLDSYVLEHKLLNRTRFAKSHKLKQKGKETVEDWGLLDDADKENLFDLIAEEFPDL